MTALPASPLARLACSNRRRGCLRQPPLRQAPVLRTIGFALFGLAGCEFSEPSPPSTQGELGQGRFEYVCVTGQDVHCAGAFPSRIAVGGKFQLEFVWNSDGHALPRLDAVSPGMLTLENRVFQARIAGTAGVVARTSAGDVVDLLHLLLMPVAAVQLDGAALDGTVTMTVGQSLQVSAVPLDDNHAALAGSLDYAWDTTEDAVFTVTAAPGDRHAALFAVAPGTAAVTVLVGETSAHAFSVVVLGDDDGSTGDTGSSDATGDGDDTGTSTDDDTGTGGGFPVVGGRFDRQEAQ